MKTETAFVITRNALGKYQGFIENLERFLAGGVLVLPVHQYRVTLLVAAGNKNEIDKQREGQSDAGAATKRKVESLQRRGNFRFKEDVKKLLCFLFDLLPGRFGKTRPVFVAHAGANDGARRDGAGS